MAQPDNNNTLSSALKTFFELRKLTGDNFPMMVPFTKNCLRVAAEYKIHSDVACLMLGKMSPALQRQFELYFPQAMLNELRKMFEKPPAVDLRFGGYYSQLAKLAPGKSVSAHLLEMKSYINQLQALGNVFLLTMIIGESNDQQVPYKDFGDFVRNFNSIARGRQVNKPNRRDQEGKRQKAKLIMNKQGLDIEWKRKLSYDEQYLRMVGMEHRALLAHIGKTRMQKLQREGLLEKGSQILLGLNSSDVPNLSSLIGLGVVSAYVKRDSADKLQQRSVKCIFVGYPKETMGYYFYFPPENKVIVARYGDFLERDLISQEFSGRDYDLEEVSIWNTLPSENTSEIPVEPESLGPPPELIPIRSSERNKSAPNHLNLNIEVEDDVVTDLREPANYKDACFDHLIRMIDYEETFSPATDIRAIRILIAIAAYYNYEIWQMDIKTAFLNGRLDGRLLYVAAILKGCKSKYPKRKFNMHNSKKGYLPMEVKHELSNEMCASTPEEVAYMKKVPYASAVGSIMYVVRCTRPDVAFAQNLVSRYQQNPGELRLEAAKIADNNCNVCNKADINGAMEVFWMINLADLSLRLLLEERDPYSEIVLGGIGVVARRLTDGDHSIKDMSKWVAV
ncbi:retrotransposon protein, putative, ty1-copia subclass [Tanacetum coccineum]